MIDYETFEKHMKDIQASIKLEDEIYDAMRKYGREYEFIYPTLIDNVIDLLMDAMGDENEWIMYYVYELQFGKNYTDGCVTDDEGNNIPLITIENLYEFLKVNNEGRNIKS